MKITRTSECTVKVNRISIDPDGSLDGAWMLVDDADEVVDSDRVMAPAESLPPEVVIAVAAIRAYVEAQSGAVVTTKQADRAAKIAAKAGGK